MLKRGILIAILVISWTLTNAQEISNQVLVVAANVANGAGYSISQTVGEPVIEYISSDRFELTQGFQQPLCRPDEGGNQGTGVNVYPNPFSDFLRIKMWGTEELDFDVTIFGIDGSVYYRNRYSCSTGIERLVVLDLSEFKRGLYFVRVESSNNKIARLFKVEKM